jgi:hypothetical protein
MKSHTGDYLALKLSETLKTYKMAEQALGVAMDNASNNDTMISELEHLLPPTAIAGPSTQIRCFGHILNLAVKALLKVFDKPKKADPEDEAEDEEGDDSDDEDDNDSDSEFDSDIDGEGDDEDKVVDYEEGQNDKIRALADDKELEELEKNIKEVKNLSRDERTMGRNTVTKVCIPLLPFVLLTQVFLLSTAS